MKTLIQAQRDSNTLLKAIRENEKLKNGIARKEALLAKKAAIQAIYADRLAHHIENSYVDSVECENFINQLGKQGADVKALRKLAHAKGIAL